MHRSRVCLDSVRAGRLGSEAAEAFSQFNQLITLANEGRQYNLTPAFQDAIDATAKLESDNYAPTNDCAYMLVVWHMDSVARPGSKYSKNTVYLTHSCE